MKTKIILVIVLAIVLLGCLFLWQKNNSANKDDSQDSLVINAANDNTQLPAANINENQVSKPAENKNTNEAGGDVMEKEKLKPTENTKDVYEYEAISIKYPAGWTVVESKNETKVLGIQIMKSEYSAAGVYPYIEVRKFYTGWEDTLEKFISQMDPDWQKNYSKITTDNGAVGYQIKQTTVVGSSEETDPYFQTYFKAGSDLYYINTSSLAETYLGETKTGYDYIVKSLSFIVK